MFLSYHLLVIVGTVRDKISGSVNNWKYALEDFSWFSYDLSEKPNEWFEMKKGLIMINYWRYENIPKGTQMWKRDWVFDQFLFVIFNIEYGTVMLYCLLLKQQETTN